MELLRAGTQNFSSSSSHTGSLLRRGEQIWGFWSVCYVAIDRTCQRLCCMGSPSPCRQDPQSGKPNAHSPPFPSLPLPHCLSVWKRERLQCFCPQVGKNTHWQDMKSNTRITEACLLFIFNEGWKLASSQNVCKHPPYQAPCVWTRSSGTGEFMPSERRQFCLEGTAPKNVSQTSIWLDSWSGNFMLGLQLRMWSYLFHSQSIIKLWSTHLNYQIIYLILSDKPPLSSLGSPTVLKCIIKNPELGI